MSQPLEVIQDLLFKDTRSKDRLTIDQTMKPNQLKTFRDLTLLKLDDRLLS